MGLSENKLNIRQLDKSDWKTYRFDEIAEKISITVNPQETNLETYVGLEHIDSGDIYIRRHGKPSDVKGGKLRCSPGDVIFGKRRAYQRKAAIVDFDGICSAHAFVLRAKENVIDPRLLPFFLHSDQFMHRMVDISVGGLSPTINWSDLKKQGFSLPPLSQQSKLIDLFLSVGGVIEANTKSLNTIDRLKTTIVNDFFDNTDDFEEHIPLNDLLNGFQNGYAFSSKGYLLEGYPIVTMANISLKGRFELKKQKYWNYDQSLARYVIDYGDLLIAMTDVTPEKNLIGRMAILDKNGPFLLNQRVGLLKLNSEKILPKYLQLYSCSKKFRWFSISHSTSGVQSNLATQDIKRAKIPYVCLSSQEAFVAKVSEIEKSIDNIELSIKHSRTFKSILLNQVF